MLNCSTCAVEMRKFGFTQTREEKLQRYRCRVCKVTKVEERAKGDLRLDTAKLLSIVSLICEGVGVRAIARLTGVHRDTVLRVIQFAGERSTELFNKHIIQLPVQAVQIDELYSFVQKKEANCKAYEVHKHGEQYTYLALEPNSKLILAFHVGKRDQDNTDIFIRDLAIRVNRSQPFDITSDGFRCYNSVVSEQFYGNASYAQLVKNFHLMKIAKERREPIRCMETTQIFGKRTVKTISTSYVERLNLNMRLFNRRFNRKTVCFSKTLDNLRHSVAIFAAFHNFCRAHGSLGKHVTPAMAAGIFQAPLTLTEFLGM